MNMKKNANTDDVNSAAEAPENRLTLQPTSCPLYTCVPLSSLSISDLEQYNSTHI